MNNHDLEITPEKRSAKRLEQMAMENKRWYEANKERQDLFEN
jgi:hypothetical protein